MEYEVCRWVSPKKGRSGNAGAGVASAGGLGVAAGSATTTGSAGFVHAAKASRQAAARTVTLIL